MSATTTGPARPAAARRRSRGRGDAGACRVWLRSRDDHARCRPRRRWAPSSLRPMSRCCRSARTSTSPSRRGPARRCGPVRAAAARAGGLPAGPAGDDPRSCGRERARHDHDRARRCSRAPPGHLAEAAARRPQQAAAASPVLGAEGAHPPSRRLLALLDGSVDSRGRAGERAATATRRRPMTLCPTYARSPSSTASMRAKPPFAPSSTP